MSKTIRPNFELFERDELNDAIAEAIVENPAFGAAVDDAVEIRLLLDELVRLRKRAGLTQGDIASLMSVRQPTVSQFETESSDPRISTLQRYARAIGCRVSVCIMDNSGVFVPRNAYRDVSTREHGDQVPVEVRAESQAFAWDADVRSKYALAR